MLKWDEVAKVGSREIYIRLEEGKAEGMGQSGTRNEGGRDWANKESPSKSQRGGWVEN
jgi:hypothetical protein